MPPSHSGHGLPYKKEKMEENKVKLRMEKDIGAISGRFYARVASAAPASTTRIKLSWGMDQKMLACMLHAHLVNMGSPGNYQATLDQLFAANVLTPIIIPQNPDSAKIFGFVPAGQCAPGNFKIKANIETPEAMEAEAPEMVVA